MKEHVQLSRIAVTDLFGLFDHIVDLRLEERVTILHGPNGVGKTVILRLIQSFFAGRYEMLLDTNFKQLLLSLSDGRGVIVARRQIGEPPERGKLALQIQSTTVSGDMHEWTQDRVENRRVAAFIDNEVPYITRIEEDLWADDRTGETYSIPELIAKFRDLLPDKLKTSLIRDPDWLQDFRSSIEVNLVETQRLLATQRRPDNRFGTPHRPRKGFASTVKTYSADLQSRIAVALATYAEHSQSLDRSFPQRMLGGPTTETLNTSDLKDRMNKLELRRAQLKNIGLIEDDTSYPFDIDTLDSATSTQKAVMTLYVEDTESKLSAFDELEEKVDLLLGNINRKFKPNKYLRTDRKSGLVVRDKRDFRIDLDSLSSGEQHELVLIYDLLFRVRSNALVLIDEPELSLHVTWQKAFLREIFAIIRASNFDVVLATHSPFIVGDRVDLMVPLALEQDDTDAISVTPVGGRSAT